MVKRQTIGENPLDSILEPVAPIRRRPAKEKEKKQRITVQISMEVIERVKNAVYWTPGLTVAALAEEALSKAVDQLEEIREEKFQDRKGELKSGRPVK